MEAVVTVTLESIELATLSAEAAQAYAYLELQTQKALVFYEGGLTSSHGNGNTGGASIRVETQPGEGQQDQKPSYS